MTRLSFSWRLLNFLNNVVTRCTQQYKLQIHTVCMSLLPSIGALAPAQNGRFSNRVMNIANNLQNTLMKDNFTKD